MCRQFALFLLSAVYALFCGCASYPVNQRSQNIDENAGYRLANRTLGEKNNEK